MMGGPCLCSGGRGGEELVVLSKTGEQNNVITFRDFHLSNRLPLVHGDEPSIAFPSTAQVDDEFGRVTV